MLYTTSLIITIVDNYNIYTMTFIENYFFNSLSFHNIFASYFLRAFFFVNSKFSMIFFYTRVRTWKEKIAPFNAILSFIPFKFSLLSNEILFKYFVAINLLTLSTIIFWFFSFFSSFFFVFFSVVISKQLENQSHLCF